MLVIRLGAHRGHIVLGPAEHCTNFDFSLFSDRFDILNRKITIFDTRRLYQTLIVSVDLYFLSDRCKISHFNVH